MTDSVYTMQLLRRSQSRLKHQWYTRSQSRLQHQWYTRSQLQLQHQWSQSQSLRWLSLAHAFTHHPLLLTCVWPSFLMNFFMFATFQFYLLTCMNAIHTYCCDYSTWLCVARKASSCDKLQLSKPLPYDTVSCIARGYHMSILTTLLTSQLLCSFLSLQKSGFVAHSVPCSVGHSNSP